MEPIFDGYTEPAAQTALRALKMACDMTEYACAGATGGTPAWMQALILRRYDEWCVACDEQDRASEVDYARNAGAIQ